MTTGNDSREPVNTYVLQDNPAINEMLLRRGATEAQCLLPTLQRLPKDAVLLDLGCGLGTITAFIARTVDDLHGAGPMVLGVDKDKASLSAARQHCESQGLTNVRFLEGDAQDLSPVFESGSAHAIYMNAVLMYSPDPGQAIAEVFRVLKPGGTAVLRDLEPGCGVWYPPSPLRTRWAELFERSIAAAGGSPGVSMRLHSLAREAGFEEAVPFGENVRIYDAELRDFCGQLAGLVSGGLGERWVSSGWCNQHEAVAIADSWSSFPEEPGAIIGHLWGGVVARKPG